LEWLSGSAEISIPWHQCEAKKDTAALSGIVKQGYLSLKSALNQIESRPGTVLLMSEMPNIAPCPGLSGDKTE
jgi:hypothetical protein